MLQGNMWEGARRSFQGEFSSTWLRFCGIAVTLGLLSSYVLVRGSLTRGVSVSTIFAAHLEQYGYFGATPSKVISDEQARFQKIHEKLRSEKVILNETKVAGASVPHRNLVHSDYNENSHISSEHPLVHRTNRLYSQAELTNYLMSIHTQEVLADELEQKTKISRDFSGLLILTSIITVFILSLSLCRTVKMIKKRRFAHSLNTIFSENKRYQTISFSDTSMARVKEAVKLEPSMV